MPKRPVRLSVAQKVPIRHAFRHLDASLSEQIDQEDAADSTLWELDDQVGILFEGGHRAYAAEGIVFQLFSKDKLLIHETTP